MRPLIMRLWVKRRIIAIYAVLLLCGWLIGGVLREITIPEMRAMNEPAIHSMVMGAFALYVILAAIPFVPGAEIGFTLLLIFGAQAAPLVYFGMVGSLVVSVHWWSLTSLHGWYLRRPCDVVLIGLVLKRRRPSSQNLTQWTAKTGWTCYHR